jgi:hypothetical protein
MNAQFNPGLSANFGVDGDVLSDSKQNGTFAHVGTHDWFFKSGNPIGKGVIDTVGKSVYTAILNSGTNYKFTKGMAFPMYSAQGGYLLLDGRYARDNFALMSSGPTSDKTAFIGGMKNGFDPTIWITNPAGLAVPDKADIIDSYVHFRRNGTVINGTSSSHLVALFGMSTLANTGDRYFDIEFYSSRINYDTVSGVFSNSGSATTGGHTKWEFNADGSLKKFGDMTISFAFSSSSVTEIALWMWVSRTDYLTLNPKDFDFVPGELNGATNNADFGYVKIMPNSGNTSTVWGSQNTSNAAAPDWGTANKQDGSNANNYNYTQYATGQFAEGGIDLSQLGIDPAFIVGGDPCIPVFTRVMFKSRSSSSFTSSLQDFIGPYSFLDAPTASAQITPKVLRCNATSTTLSPITIIPGASYTWSTSNGNIVTNPNATTITINKGGKYYLNAAIVAGCIPSIDSTIVGEDYYQPVSSAVTTGQIDLNNPLSTASIWGGDVAASNFATPYGGSAGLSWNWTGPNGFTSTARNNTVSQVGTYTLVLTETRNGCKDTAITPVTPFQTLPVKITEFSAVKKENDRVLLNWATADETPQTVELMRSYNSIDYSTITYALVDMSNPNQTFSYTDNVSNRTSTRVYYKLKITEASGSVRYSWVISLNYAANSTIKFSASPNPAVNYTVLSITNDKSATGIMQIVDMNGRILLDKTIKMEKGTNQVMVNEVERLKKGMYIIRLMTEGETLTQKLVKSE